MDFARVYLYIFIYVQFMCFGYCKRFETRCKLARELLRVGVPKDLFLGQWVCLIEQESNRNTQELKIRNGIKYYGLYQIPGRWCKVGKNGGECNLPCELLLDDDIRDDAACANLIFHTKGLQYWPKWFNRCRNNNFYTEEIYKCPDLQFPPNARQSYVNSPKSLLIQVLIERVQDKNIPVI